MNTLSESHYTLSFWQNLRTYKWRALIPVLFVVLLVNAPATSRGAAAAVETDTLFADLVLGGGLLFDGPSCACTSTSGDIYILDGARGCVVVCDRAGLPIKEIASDWSGDRLSSPLDMDIDQKSRLYVADTLNKRIVVMDDAGDVLSHIYVGFRIRTIEVLPDGTIFAPAGPAAESHLINVYSWQGEKLVEIGERIRYGAAGQTLNCANFFHASFNRKSGRLAVARVAVPLVTLLDLRSNSGRSFQVRHSSIDGVRSRFFNSLSRRFCQSGRRLAPNPEIEDYLADIAATIAEGENALFSNYIAGAEYCGERLYLLVGGDLLEVSPAGTVRSHSVLRQADSRKVWSHRMWISDDGTLVTVDRHHNKTVHTFQLPDPGS